MTCNQWKSVGSFRRSLLQLGDSPEEGKKVIIIISKHRRLTQTHLNTKTHKTHIHTHLLGMRGIDTWANTTKKYTLTHTDRQGNMFEGRGATLGNGFIFVQWNAAAKCAGSSRTLPLWKRINFQRLFGDECVWSSILFAKYFVVMQAISQKT